MPYLVVCGVFYERTKSVIINNSSAAGAVTGLTDNSGHSALQIAVKLGHIAIIDQLINAGGMGGECVHCQVATRAQICNSMSM